MDLEGFVQLSRQSVEATRQKVRNLNIFDFNYVPRRIYLRPEAKVLVDAMVQFDAMGLPFNLYLFGSRGSGKTLLAKYLRSFLENQIKTPMVYLNCRFHNTSSKVFSEILGKKARGFSTGELYQLFTRKYDQLILFLDEVDMLSDRDRDKDLLYLLSRSEKRFMVVLLSNHPGFFKKMDLSARSTLQLERIFFRNYTAPEIEEILKIRCKEGLCAYELADLKQIAALTCRDNHGDVRIAIKSLQYLLTGRQSEVLACFEAARRDIYSDLVSDQSDCVLVILKAISTARQKLVKPVYEHYKKICEAYRESPYSYMHFYNHLSYLQGIGLLLLVATKVHRGTSNSIELLFDQAVLEKVFHQRFGRDT